MRNPHDIILRPVLTEKGYDGIADKQYVFEVDGANKIEKKTLKPYLRYKGMKINTSHHGQDAPGQNIRQDTGS